MKKKHKRLLSIILCCSMLLGLLPFAAMAENANAADITGGIIRLTREQYHRQAIPLPMQPPSMYPPPAAVMGLPKPHQQP